MSNQAPNVRVVSVPMPAVAAGVDDTSGVCVVPFDGTVTGVSYVPDAAITGADTNTRTYTLYNRGQAGAGTTAIATLSMTSGINGVKGDEKVITLNATPANLVVASGDVLQWESLHVSSGLADPGGMVNVTLSRS